MKAFFEDKLINEKLVSRLVKEVKKDQLEKTLDEIDYFSELRSRVISKCDFSIEENEEINLIKKINNAKFKNLQA